MNIFVISLKNSIVRQKKITEQLQSLNLNFEFIDAVFGKDFYNNTAYFNVEKSLKFERRKMNAGEIGCALSHIKTYNTIIERNLPYALILEDDALISTDVPSVLHNLEPHITQGDLITLERCDIYLKKNMINLFNHYNLVNPKMVKYGSMCQTAGYVITNKAAKIIASFNMPIIVPADSWEHYIKTIHFKGIIPSQTLIQQDETQESTIITGIRPTAHKKTVQGLLFYAFYTRCPLGIFLKKIYKVIFKRDKHNN